MQSWIEPILRDHSDALEWIRSTSVLTTWLMLRTGTKRGHVPDPRPTKSRFPVQMELVEELSKISFDRSYGAEHYTPMLTHILGYPKFERRSANYTHYLQTCITERFLSNTSGSSTHLFCRFACIHPFPASLDTDTCTHSPIRQGEAGKHSGT